MSVSDHLRLASIVTGLSMTFSASLADRSFVVSLRSQRYMSPWFTHLATIVYSDTIAKPSTTGFLPLSLSLDGRRKPTMNGLYLVSLLTFSASIFPYYTIYIFHLTFDI